MEPTEKMFDVINRLFWRNTKETLPRRGESVLVYCDKFPGSGMTVCLYDTFTGYPEQTENFFPATSSVSMRGSYTKGIIRMRQGHIL